ncbi:MAG: tetraacyldisaccharide 4'-kinase [Deltaproteobacteria bacterium]|nr:MAG: tetraacyldisaccharide 4'-kinase [Deltaproteobacteria bacterium]
MRRIYNFFRQLLFRKEISWWLNLVLLPLLLFSLIYRFVLQVRSLFYRREIFPSKRINCPTISIGNITLGGSGKTPMVAYLAAALRDKGFKVAVLSRGYKRKHPGRLALVSDGKEVILGVDEAGDEPYMLARKLNGVPIIVGKDRYQSGLLARNNFSVDGVVLDDGFAYLGLKRDLDIILIDGEIGFGSKKLLPRGILREPLKALARAGLFVINRAEDTREIEELLRRYNPASPVFRSRFSFDKFININKREEVEQEKVKENKILAFCGTANPSSFRQSLQELELDIAEFIEFPDHWYYRQSDLKRIAKMAQGLGVDYIVTTEKDGVKLEGRIEEETPPWLMLLIKISMDDSDSFLDYLSPIFRKKAG